MRSASLAFAMVLAACGGHHDVEPAPSPTDVELQPGTPTDVTPTGARPLGPDEPRIVGYAGTGGGPGSPSVSGVARSAQTLLQRCWVDELRGGAVHEGFHGSLHVVTGADGVVTSATATMQANGANVAPPDELVECVERTGRELQFPAAPSGNAYEIPIVFDPGR